MLPLKNWLFAQDEQDKGKDIDREKSAEINENAEIPKQEGTSEKQEPQSGQQEENTVSASWESFIANVKNVTSDVASKTVTVASKLKETVEEKTVFGSFMREQEQFIKTRQAKRIDTAVPPWVGYGEEEIMKNRILALSKDDRNFLRDPPSGADFHFDATTSYPVALATLTVDDNLKLMRFKLVPKTVNEDTFWRNYFYRVALVKQSVQLSSLAEASVKVATDSDAKLSTPKTTDVSKIDGVKDISKDQIAPINTDAVEKVPDEDDKPEIPDTSITHEFVSETYANAELSQAELADEMHQLGIRKKSGESPNNDTNEAGKDTVEGNVHDIEDAMAATEADQELQDWEIELQKELEEYEVVNDANDHSAIEEEIEHMLELSADTS